MKCSEESSKQYKVEIKVKFSIFNVSSSGSLLFSYIKKERNGQKERGEKKGGETRIKKLFLTDLFLYYQCKRVHSD